MADIKKLALLIATSLAELTKEELEELVKQLGEVHNIHPSKPEVVEVVAEEKVEEKATVNVILNAIGTQKTVVIRALKEKLNMKLSDAMNIVKDVANGPVVIQENASKTEAGELQEKLIGVGAEVTLT